LFNVLENNVTQRVFIPIKLDRTPENIIPFKQTELIFEKIIRPMHKYDYFGKIRAITKKVIAKNIHKEVDFVHAHNLFTDGAVAYNLKKKFGLKYVVAVRTTDIGLQYKYMFHRRARIQKVLLEAEHIIFISPTYKDKLLHMMSKSFINKIKDKIQIVPNGINTIWLENKQPPSQKELTTTVNLIYVGQIMQRKNIHGIIDAVEVLRKKENKEYNLTIIGGENIYEEAYFNTFQATIKDKKWISYLGKINDKAKLIEHYRNSDIFVMPSRAELFGLVYIEALSQGKPVLYSKGEGINGYLEAKNVGVAVNPNDIDEIATGIENIVRIYTEYANFDDVIKPFNWASVTNQYIKMYS
tara:strand:+ start:15844 stop:16908 length:1065 start_codon:yes stop_codon:yes gene_type:complete